jgi:hypothetical protein
MGKNGEGRGIWYKYCVYMCMNVKMIFVETTAGMEGE